MRKDYDDYDELLKYFNENLLKASKLPLKYFKNKNEKRMKRIKNLLN